MRIPSGVTDQYIYFVAVDATDFTTRETGLSSFTVYRSRNGGAAAAFTTPTINETDTTNMPGVYELLLDEDMTIDSGDDSQEMVFHITHAGMAPVTRTIELYRPKITAGNTLTVASDGDLTEVNTLTGHTAQTGDSYARLGAPAGASIAADLVVIDDFVDSLETRIPDTISLANINAEVDTALADIGLDHLISSALPTNWATDVASGSVFDNIADDGTAAFDRTTDSLQAVRDHVGDGTNLTEAGGDGDHLTEAGGTGDQLTALATAAALATVDTNVDSILADTGTDGVVLSAATNNAIADAILDRDMSTGTDSGSTTVRTVRQALRFLRNKWSISGGTLTVTKEDDSTTSWTTALTTDAAADPVTASDPAGP